MLIRKYNPTDCKALTELFYETVHKINSTDYTAEQLNVWADGNPNLEEWNKSFREHYTVVAEINGIIVGFGDIDKTGYLDRLFVHKDFQHIGIATEICDCLEKAFPTEKITSHVSITARPFFESRGYKVIMEQQIVRKDIVLTNYIMEKT